MRPGQKMTDSNGVQIALFPLEYMNISQGENGSYSHQGTLNIDFLGWGSSGRILKCPYYAPCDCRVVYHTSFYNVWQSLEQVITPTGKRQICFIVMHDDSPPSYGTVKRQGDLLGHTGTNDPGGATTGDHVHINTAYGSYQGQHQVPPDNQWELINSSHIYETFYVNDTVILNGYGYNWLTYQGGITPAKKYKFKWVLYARKLRNNIVR